MKFTKSRITTAIITALLPLSVMANEATTSLDIQQINLVTTPDNSVSSLPAGFVEYDGKLFFTAKDNKHGKELWVFDKETGETSLVEDLYAGIKSNGVANSSNIANLVVYNNKLYFTGSYEVEGTAVHGKLLSYDGTAITPIDTPIDGDSANMALGLNYLTVFDGQLYFSAYDQARQTSTELYRFDGTKATLVANINTGSNRPSNPANLTVLGDKLVFAANNGSTGDELKAYDTTNGLQDLGDIRAGSYGSVTKNTMSPFVADGVLYFNANDYTNGAEVWAYNGTDAPAMIADINEGSTAWYGYGSSPSNFSYINGKLYFSAQANTATGKELYYYNTTTKTFSLVADINPDGASKPSSLTVYNDEIYFAATRNGSTDLFRLDGNLAIPFDTLYADGNSNVKNLFVYGGKLYFSGTEGIHGEELHSYDALTGDFSLIADINQVEDGSDPSALISFNNKLYMSANLEDGSGQELYTFEDATAETQLVKDINDGGDAKPGSTTVIGSNLYFTANDGLSGAEPHVYNSETDTVELLADLKAGSAGSEATEYVELNGKIYFTAKSASSNSTLNVFDPVNNTVDAIDMGETVKATQLTVFNNKLYFAGKKSTVEYGNELYSYDEENGVVLAYNLDPNIYFGSYERSGDPKYMTVFNGKLYFAASLMGKNTLWSFDGETAEQITINPTASASVKDVTVYGDKLYFTANHPMTGREILSYDGSSLKIAANLFPDVQGEAPIGSDPHNLAVYKNKLYFTASGDDSKGYELWVYDAATNNHALVKDIAEGVSGSFPDNMTVHNGKLFFTANDGDSGQELYSLYEDAPLSGTIEVTGELVEGYQLTATVSLDDESELTDIFYQWQRNGSAIDGATSLEYILATADIDTEISLAVTATDIAGNVETIESAVFGPIDGDYDGDGLGDLVDTDDDNDLVPDADDAFPFDETESVDTDMDGIGNNADTDDDDDGVEDAADDFPLDASESIDTDGDGMGNNADTDDDNDGVADTADAFPLDATESTDTDGDGIGDNTDTDIDGDGVPNDEDQDDFDPNVGAKSSSSGSFGGWMMGLVLLALGRRRKS